ncbi:hypothetical protein SeMB42_g01423 [Synchytrium endobioticum]|uniref:Uncharacterized protein n=1 Tax=Synchytrium endobioticum TaxID=286115 RepID=A0A507DNH3_9FUNG|nr:hypothetical protein SeMB42_g01423 [Synchytrium endobioticum]
MSLIYGTGYPSDIYLDCRDRIVSCGGGRQHNLTQISYFLHNNGLNLYYLKNMLYIYKNVKANRTSQDEHNYLISIKLLTILTQPAPNQTIPLPSVNHQREIKKKKLPWSTSFAQ